MKWERFSIMAQSKAAKRRDHDTDSAARHETLGRRLREIRKAKGLTLTDLAQRCDLAVSTLSRAERGLLALTYDKMMKVAAGLDMDISALFRDEGQALTATQLAVARRGEVLVQETATYRYELLFADVWHKGMTPMTGTVKAHSRADFSDFIRHPGQEFLFVLSGTLTVYTENNDPVTLTPGESIYFDSSMGHVYTSTSHEDCRILVVCLPGGASGAPLQPGCT